MGVAIITIPSTISSNVKVSALVEIVIGPGITFGAGVDGVVDVSSGRGSSDGAGGNAVSEFEFDVGDESSTVTLSEGAV